VNATSPSSSPEATRSLEAEATDTDPTERTVRRLVLDPIDRVSEMLFGLFMALTFVGAVSVTDAGQSDIRAMMIAALGCNLAWGLVDAVMYLVRTITDRGRSLTLSRIVRSLDRPERARRVIRGALPGAVAKVISDAEVDAIHGRLAALPPAAARARFNRDDLLAAVAIFLIVAGSTFPVVLPFLVFDDVAVAKTLSRGIALVMLFGGGLALGRYAGYGSWKAGLSMVGLGTALVIAIMALGG